MVPLRKSILSTFIMENHMAKSLSNLSIVLHCFESKRKADTLTLANCLYLVSSPYK